jgi:hypothetical protein
VKLRWALIPFVLIVGLFLFFQSGKGIYQISFVTLILFWCLAVGINQNLWFIGTRLKKLLGGKEDLDD